MASQTWSITVNEDTVAKVNTIIEGMIDDFWNYIDANHTPTKISLSANLTFDVENGAGTSQTPTFTWSWIEDGAVQNTRMKNIWNAFATGLTNMEGASTYTTVNSLSGNINLTIEY